jgi:predicted O-methyltransferase YrrM
MTLQEFLDTCEGIEKASPSATMHWLYATVAALHATLDRAPFCVEIGSWCGVTAVAMAMAGGNVLCVDPFTVSDAQTKERMLHSFANGTPPFLHFTGNALRTGLGHRLLPVVGLSTDVAPLLPSGCVDLVFIDGDHEDVATDVDVWGPKVRPGGVLCGHDAGQPAVRAAAENWAYAHDVPVTWEASETACWSILTPKAQEA